MELMGFGFKLFYIVIPACGITGNTIIIIATVKYKQLRNACNILIAAIALGDILHQAGFMITVLLHELLEDHTITQRNCLYVQTLPLFGVSSAELLLLSVALDRLFSLHHFYKSVIAVNRVVYVTCHIGVSIVLSLSFLAWAYAAHYENIETLCTLTSSMQGLLLPVFNDALMATNLCILVVYAVFLFRVRKVVVGQLHFVCILYV
ncbi:hypothetical protein Y032_0002g625 [Ancylostoma ceylanicum]|uniref:G-protein coupled receptors family 1 profile domain-containing protein n=1 Tax=Ancylostoma ceylanicum TaxID=53326 RepID=A0A016W1K5_9BILA|nr:hypothetical protein Y032_0002g625 [Ancylostoma ceylanicum]